MLFSVPWSRPSWLAVSFSAYVIVSHSTVRTSTLNLAVNSLWTYGKCHLRHEALLVLIAFFTMRRCASAVYAVVVCLSVRPSVHMSFRPLQAALYQNC